MAGNTLTISERGNFPSPTDYETMTDFAQKAIQSGFLPDTIKTPEAAFYILMKGRELGIAPTQAFTSIAIIKGKPTISSELMMALVYRDCPGAKIHFAETDNQSCLIKANRPGQEPAAFEFTIEDAKKALLMNSSGWQKYPAAMLRARAISAMCKALFPDVIMGCYIPEELGGEDEPSKAEDAPRDVTPTEEPPEPAGPEPAAPEPAEPSAAPDYKAMSESLLSQVSDEGMVARARGYLAEGGDPKVVADYLTKVLDEQRKAKGN